ncbi:MAG TPA: CmcJ/NvfI family oxidoreductase [Woeseiaceae bacterium]|nr:CmcJ/NvfI family oxidoreductase [Woeseiaceae bacterium]
MKRQPISTMAGGPPGPLPRRTGSLTARLKFLADLDGPLAYVPSKGGGDSTEHLGNFTTREVAVHDARSHLRDTRLDAEGFLLVTQPTAVTDFHHDAQIEAVHHEEVRALLTRLTGARRVEIFDDTRRASSRDRQRERKTRDPAAIVHNDYTARSGVKRLRDHFADASDASEEAERLLDRRFAIINVWRSTAGPVLNHPLVMADATTVREEDLVAVERRGEDRIGELQVALHHPEQRWYYYPRMQPDEVLVFKTFDSATDGRTRFTLHSSFDDPTAPAGAPPRESIETRCLVFF